MKYWKIGKNAFAEFMYVYAESFDKALAIARKFDNSFCEGRVVEFITAQNNKNNKNNKNKMTII